MAIEPMVFQRLRTRLHLHGSIISREWERLQRSEQKKARTTDTAIVYNVGGSAGNRLILMRGDTVQSGFKLQWSTRIGFYWAPLIGYAGLIFYLSSFPQSLEFMPMFLEDVGDKVVHMAEYGLLGILSYRALRNASGRWAARYAVALAIAVAVLYGITDEVHQAFVPEREADPWDLVADAAGAGLGAWCWHRFAPKQPAAEVS